MRILYSIYTLLKKTPYQKIRELIVFTARKHGYSSAKVFKDMLYNFLVNNTSFIEYFYFDFISKSEKEKNEYATAYWMYRFHQRMNQKTFTSIFSDKVAFHKYFREFITHDHFAVNEGNPERFISWLDQKPKEYLIGKNSTGVGGNTIKKYKVSKDNGEWRIDNISPGKFLKSARALNIDLIEECIIQHEELNKLNSGSINTIRVITILNPSLEVGILAAIIRIGVNCVADNFSMGGIAARVDVETGTICSPVVYKDPRYKVIDDLHPVSGVKVSGRVIPYWEETLKMVKEATLVVPQVRTVGWDVAITPDGPVLVEGNHNWNKDILQITLRKGMKQKIRELADDLPKSHTNKPISYVKSQL